METFTITQAGEQHARAWAALRSALWPDCSPSQHEADIHDFIAEAAQGRQQVCFLAMRGGSPIGFAEASIRHDYVNGCETSPVGFLEGIYVLEASRRGGVAGALLQSIEAWAGRLGCTELGSDAALDNPRSHAFHHGLGFDETERVVFFRKRIRPQRQGLPT